MVAVLEARRAKAAPDTPTVAEAGVPGYAIPDTWSGLLGPAGLPAAIVNQLNAAVVKALGFPDVRERLEAAGFEVRGSTPQEFSDGLVRNYETYQKIVTTLGIQPETVSRYETGDVPVSLAVLFRLAKALGAGVDELLNIPATQLSVDEVALVSEWRLLDERGQRLLLEMIRWGRGRRSAPVRKPS